MIPPTPSAPNTSPPNAATSASFSQNYQPARNESPSTFAWPSMIPAISSTPKVSARNRARSSRKSPAFNSRKFPKRPSAADRPEFTISCNHKRPTNSATAKPNSSRLFNLTSSPPAIPSASSNNKPLSTAPATTSPSSTPSNSSTPPSAVSPSTLCANDTPSQKNKSSFPLPTQSPSLSPTSAATSAPDAPPNILPPPRPRSSPPPAATQSIPWPQT